MQSENENTVDIKQVYEELKEQFEQQKFNLDGISQFNDYLHTFSECFDLSTLTELLLLYRQELESEIGGIKGLAETLLKIAGNPSGVVSFDGVFAQLREHPQVATLPKVQSDKERLQEEYDEQCRKDTSFRENCSFEFYLELAQDKIPAMLEANTLPPIPTPPPSTPTVSPEHFSDASSFIPIDDTVFPELKERAPSVVITAPPEQDFPGVHALVNLMIPFGSSHSRLFAQANQAVPAVVSPPKEVEIESLLTGFLDANRSMSSNDLSKALVKFLSPHAKMLACYKDQYEMMLAILGSDNVLQPSDALIAQLEKIIEPYRPKQEPKPPESSNSLTR